jgi:disulfide bond formation protein DsbB
MLNRPLAVQSLERWLNSLELIGIVALLLLAFAFQFLLQELPCPLCLLQRIGFLLTSVGFLCNLRFGLRPSHYAMSLLSALFTAFVALRQIALHVIPGTGSYGNAMFGLHLYTWSFIIAMAIVLFTTIILSLDIQYSYQKPPRRHWSIHLLALFILVLAIANGASAWMECGFKQCPDNPTHYIH